MSYSEPVKPGDPPFSLPLHRAITAEEIALIRWLLDQAGAEARPFVGQLDKLSVEGRCGCGACPSIELSVDGKVASRSGHRTVIAEGQGESASGEPILVTLSVCEGLLCELNVTGFGDGSQETTLPRLASLKPAPKALR